MKICLISYEYPPYPGGGVATYAGAAAAALAEAGHQVHVITNRETFGRTEPKWREPIRTEGNLVTHRLDLFDKDYNVPDGTSFFDQKLRKWENVQVQHRAEWAQHASTLAALQIADYVENLHFEINFDVIEAADMFAESFFILRRRVASGFRRYPPVSIIAHTSSRETMNVACDTALLGDGMVRELIFREDWCMQNADGLQPCSTSLLRRYEKWFGDALPTNRRSIPNFIHLQPGDAPLPESLQKAGRYLLTVGRIELRKGTDIAVRAFVELMEEYPDLHIAFLGDENWRVGESFDEFLSDCLPAKHRDRVIHLGQLERDVVFTACRDAVAFLHPARWDNWPCVVLEAMSVGATCIVSDHGGHAEMIEDGTSGLVFPTEDHTALAGCIRRVLDEDGLAERLRTGATERIRVITDFDLICAEKIRWFETLIQSSPKPDLLATGMVVLDTGDADETTAQASIKAFDQTLPDADRWDRIALGNDRTCTFDLPRGWRYVSAMNATPWQDMPDDGVVIYALAGATPEQSGINGLLGVLQNAQPPVGSFLWLSPQSSSVFPYRSDTGATGLLLGQSALPPLFAVRAQELHSARHFSGLHTPTSRLCVMLTAAASREGFVFRHTGDVGGDFAGPLPQAEISDQQLALGYLGAAGLMTDTALWLGTTPWWG